LHLIRGDGFKTSSREKEGKRGDESVSVIEARRDAGVLAAVVVDDD